MLSGGNHASFQTISLSDVKSAWALNMGYYPDITKILLVAEYEASEKNGAESRGESCVDGAESGHMFRDRGEGCGQETATSE